MRHLMRIKVLLLPLLCAIAGCAGVSNLSVEQVAKLSNADLCYLNETAPVGFISLEVNRRMTQQSLRCGDYHGEILSALAKRDEGFFGGHTVIPMAFLNEEDCKGVQLGQVRRSDTTVTKSTYTVTEITTHGFYQQVHNRANRYVYVWLNANSDEGRQFTKFVKFGPRQSSIVRLGNATENLDISIIGCRSF